MQTFEQYNKDNPVIICECGAKFRKFGVDRNGNERTYTECMDCHMENLANQTAKYKENTESEDINF